MRQQIIGDHRLDENGNPAGGETNGRGIRIRWQNGPLGRPPLRQEPNGAFVEGVIEAALDRLRFYQTASDGRFACDENEKMIECLSNALEWADYRTEMRERRGVEGTHKP